MRAKFIYEFLNEELVDTIAGRYGFGKIEIYKNPPSITRMNSWARALTDQDGNFYITTSEEEQEKYDIPLTHIDMIDILSKHGVKTFWNRDTEMYENGICWQRNGKSNEFLLSESYGSRQKSINYVKNFMNSIDMFKPKNTKFTLKIMYEDEPLRVL